MPCRRAHALCAVLTLHVSVAVLLALSFSRQSPPWRTNASSKTFWQPQSFSKSFWNREQQLLDLVHNPILLAAAQDLLNDTGPLDPCDPDHRVPTLIPDYSTLPRPLQDFLLHMRCRSYPVLIRPLHPCADRPFLLMVIKSLVPHFDRRQAIRETWGRAGDLANRTVATVFLLGRTSTQDHFPDLQGMLEHEAGFHRDVLQWDFRETFFNITLKEVLFLDWFSQRCPDAQFVLKGDDDVFVNTFRVLDYLENLPSSRAKDLFVGDVITAASPHRDKRIKYFIPESLFSGTYPPYAGGGGYLFSGDLALRLRGASRRVVLFPIDDVYTGMCLGKLGLVPTKHPGFRTFDIDRKHRDNLCIYRNLMMVHSRTPEEMLKIWPWIAHPELDCQ
ncbi:N-acetyllactosaminide beta-1,3-N-acetylglucosaminyltransferase 2a [Neosynchiropus ocellatus]